MLGRNLIVAAMAAMMTACMSFSDRPLRPVRDALSAQMPDIYLEKEVAINMGKGWFNFLDVVTLNEADLSEIDHLQVAVYKVHGHDGNTRFSDEAFEASLRSKGDDLTWERIVKVREEGEQVWIYAGMDLARNRLEGLAVFVYERDELVLINMEGDLNEMLEYAMAPGRGHRGVYNGV